MEDSTFVPGTVSSLDDLSGDSDAAFTSATDNRLGRQEKAKAIIAKLTPRETQVLHLMIDGNSSKQIAHRLGLSIKTISAYRRNMFMRLGVHNSAVAVSLGVLAGLGDFPCFHDNATGKKYSWRWSLPEKW